MSDHKLKGFVSFKQIHDGTYFLSDSYQTMAECKKAFGSSDVEGYIDLSLVPNEAIKPI